MNLKNLDFQKLLDGVLTQGQELAQQGLQKAEDLAGVPEEGEEREAMLGGMGKGAMAAGALALLLGTGAGRKVTGSALKLGSVAALGTVAYKAFQKYQQNQGVVGDIGTPVGELSGDKAKARQIALLKAMIGAAKADGHIDADETAKISEQMNALGLSEAALEQIKEELDAPLDAADIAAAADSPEAAAEMYLMTRVIVNVDNPAERGYLDDLAAALGLDAEVTALLEEEAANA